MELVDWYLQVLGNPELHDWWIVGRDVPKSNANFMSKSRSVSWVNHLGMVDTSKLFWSFDYLTGVCQGSRVKGQCYISSCLDVGYYYYGKSVSGAVSCTWIFSRKTKMKDPKKHPWSFTTISIYLLIVLKLGLPATRAKAIFTSS